MTTTVVLIRDTDKAARDRTRDVHDLFYAEGKRCRPPERGAGGSPRPTSAFTTREWFAKILPQGKSCMRDRRCRRGRYRNDHAGAKNAGEQACYTAEPRAVRKSWMRNCGNCHPECIEDYIARKGYQGIKRALYDLTPEKAHRRIENKPACRAAAARISHLPQVVACEKTRFRRPEIRYCNGDEGDPART